jgi:hypothetical protein
VKFIVLILLAAVVVSLFSGLFFLVKDRDKPESTRMLQSLKIRVGLSITLILVKPLSVTRWTYSPHGADQRPERQKPLPYIQ